MNHSLESGVRATPFTSGRMPRGRGIIALHARELPFPSQARDGGWRAPSPKFEQGIIASFCTIFTLRLRPVNDAAISLPNGPLSSTLVPPSRWCGTRRSPNISENDGGWSSVRWWALKDLNLRPTDYESAALTAELRAQAFLFHCITAILSNRILASYAQFYAHLFPRNGLIGHFQLLEGTLDRLGRRMHVPL